MSSISFLLRFLLGGIIKLIIGGNMKKRAGLIALVAMLGIVLITASVTNIGTRAFQYCSNLSTITFAPNSQLTSINDWFYGSGLTSIGSGAFSNTGITSITIPSSVTSIGAYAFDECNNFTSAVFANPNGWSADGTPLASSDLSNTSTAATYLKSTYRGTLTRSN